MTPDEANDGRPHNPSTITGSDDSNAASTLVRSGSDKMGCRVTLTKLSSESKWAGTERA